MKKTNYYCDICRNQIESLSFIIKLDSQTGLIIPEDKQCCSVKCAREWLKQLEINTGLY